MNEVCECCDWRMKRLVGGCGHGYGGQKHCSVPFHMESSDFFSWFYEHDVMFGTDMIIGFRGVLTEVFPVENGCFRCDVIFIIYHRLRNRLEVL